MNNEMTETGILKNAAENLALFFQGLLEQVFGASARREVFGAITWGDIGAALCVVTILLLVTGLVAAWLRGKARGFKAGEESTPWRKELLLAAGKPVYLLIWIYGMYFVLAPLIAKSGTGAEAEWLAGLVRKVFDLALFALVIWLFFRFTRVIELWLMAGAKKSEGKWDDLLVPLVVRTVRVIVPLIAVILALPLIGLPAAYDSVVGKVTSLSVIGVVAWILFQGVGVIEKVLLAKYDITAADNLEARKVYTQVKVLGKTLYFVIALFTVASMLMVFEEVRRFGTNILASAGVLGIIIGFAAQRTIANLFAGFQLAMTQPIRLDDVVVVEGEWGRIEEITLTYVVVKIWDERRLVLPLSYFIEKPFQNWTRTSSEILGSIFVFADYSLPVEQIRTEVKRLVESNPNWDKKFWNVQVTDASERAMQIRVLATASDSGKAWNMRCEIREQLIAYLQKSHPDSLPKVRAELEGSLKNARDNNAAA